jgi:hypothetical protein
MKILLKNSVKNPKDLNTPKILWNSKGSKSSKKNPMKFLDSKKPYKHITVQVSHVKQKQKIIVIKITLQGKNGLQYPRAQLLSIQ